MHPRSFWQLSDCEKARDLYNACVQLTQLGFRFMSKRALITGVNGQDGSYLSEYLLELGYEVHGFIRRSSFHNTENIDHLMGNSSFILHYGDLSDAGSVMQALAHTRPEEIYNLAAQSHVKVSFDNPDYTGDVNGLGFLRILEAVRILGLTETKVYQASTSELFGEVLEIPQSEKTHFNPQSPYAIAKEYAFSIGKQYREAYGLFVCNGILFNHESPRRGETFVTRKVTKAVAEFAMGRRTKPLQLGNLDAMRDWGHAKDYVKAQHKILQMQYPSDYVIATGVQHSIRDLVDTAFSVVGATIEWEGSEIEERGILSNSAFGGHGLSIGDTVVEVNPEFFRPAEVRSLIGDSRKAQNELSWQFEYSFEALISEMVLADKASLK